MPLRLETHNPTAVSDILATLFEGESIPPFDDLITSGDSVPDIASKLTRLFAGRNKAKISYQHSQLGLAVAGIKLAIYPEPDGCTFVVDGDTARFYDKLKKLNNVYTHSW